MQNVLTLDSLFYNGSVIDPMFSCWTAHLHITEADLGIEPSPEVSRALSLGVHRLAPKESLEPLRAIITRAKALIEYYTLPFPMIRGARYLPAANKEKLIAGLMELQTLYNAAADKFAYADYEEMRARHILTIDSALKRAARNEGAAAAATERIRAAYPAAREVRGKFGMNWTLYTLRGAASAEAADAMEAEAAKVREIISEMMGSLYNDVSERIGAIVDIVAKGGTIRSTTVKATEDLFQRMESCNIFNDRTLADMIGKFRRAFRDAVELEGATNGRAEGIIGTLDAMRGTLETSFADAVREAETNLTAAGRRKLDLTPAQAEG